MKKSIAIVIYIVLTSILYSNEITSKEKYNVNYVKLDNNKNINYFEKYNKFNNLGIAFLIPGSILLSGTALIGTPFIVTDKVYQVNANSTENEIMLSTLGHVLYYSTFSLGLIFNLFAIYNFLKSNDYYKKWKVKNTISTIDFEIKENKIFLCFKYNI